MSPIFVRSLPFGLYIALLALEGLLPGWAHGFDVRWLYPVKAGVVALALAVLWRHYTELKSFALPLKDWLLSLVVGARYSEANPEALVTVSVVAAAGVAQMV